MENDEFNKNDLMVSEKLGALDSRMTSMEKGQTEGFKTLHVKMDSYHKRTDTQNQRLVKIEEKQKTMYRDLGIIGIIIFAIVTGAKWVGVKTLTLLR